jgi:glycosyltransferase involved in cell wall biosynthesis
VLFIVSNPPFLGLLGYGFKRLRKQRYVVLVYDVYPDILLALGKLKDGIFANVWRRLNRFILEHADAVITIGHDMERVLEKHYNLHKTRVGKAVVIPNWADVEAIKPLAKEENWFARKHDLLHKTTVLYSGNMGNTHDIKGVLAVARLLKDKPHIHFLFIGEGAKWALVENSIQENGLNNITLLPFQPEEVLPFSMTTGDIGIVPYYPGTEGCIVPSKSYYYMAAGVVPVIISSQPNDLAEMVESRRCGFAVASGDPKMLADKILELGDDSARLKAYKEAARHVAEESYSRKNTSEFSRLISQLVLADE